MVLTDGHPRAVASLANNAILTRSAQGVRCAIAAATLVWSEADTRPAPGADSTPDSDPDPGPTTGTSAAPSASAAECAAAAGPGHRLQRFPPPATVVLSAGHDFKAPKDALVSVLALPTPVAAGAVYATTGAVLRCSQGGFMALLGADVAFFERFHVALLDTASHLLRRADSEGVAARVKALIATAAGGSLRADPAAAEPDGHGDEKGASGTPLCMVSEAVGDAVLAAAVTAPGSLSILAPSRGGSLERLVRCAARTRAFKSVRFPGVGAWLSAAVLGGAAVEGASDASAGSMQLLVLQPV